MKSEVHFISTQFSVAHDAGSTVTSTGTVYHHDVADLHLFLVNLPYATVSKSIFRREFFETISINLSKSQSLSLSLPKKTTTKHIYCSYVYTTMTRPSDHKHLVLIRHEQCTGYTLEWIIFCINNFYKEIQGLPLWGKAKIVPFHFFSSLSTKQLFCQATTTPVFAQW